MVGIYKLKHIPTGLYYKPSNGTSSNLSKRGKIYQTNINALLVNSDTITISISKKQYKEYKDLFDPSNILTASRGDYYLRCKKTDFEITYINP